MAIGFFLIPLSQIAGAISSVRPHTSGSDVVSAVGAFRGWIWVASHWTGAAGLWVASMSLFWHVLRKRRVPSFDAEKTAPRSARSLGDLKRLLQVAVALFALIGVAYTAFIVFANWFLPNCTRTSSEARSPDGKHFAVFEQTTCEDRSRSRATVTMGAADRKERVVWLDVKGTTDVRLTWNGDRELIVTLPESAIVKRYGPYDEWPRIIERRVPSQ